MLRLQRILIAYDFSPCADRALRYALRIAGRSDADLHVFFAEVLHGEPAPGAPQQSTIDRMRAQLEDTARSDEQDAIDLERLHFAVQRDVAAAPAIMDYAEKHDVDLIVMGTHGRRGVQRLLLGSVTQEVVRLSSCPVFTIRGAETTPTPIDVRSILVPIDFSKHAREALRHAKEIGALFDARLDLLHVVEDTLHPAFYAPGYTSIYDVDPNIDKKALEHLKRFYAETEGPGDKVRFEVRPGVAPREIIRYADEQPSDLIVMSTHGLTGLDYFFAGSVTERVVRRVACPVLTVKSFGKSLVHHPEESAIAKSQS